MSCHTSQRDKQEAGQKVLALTAAGEKGASAAAWSCLDGLWEAMGRGTELRAGQPAVLAQAVRALLGMWQVQLPAISQGGTALCLPPPAPRNAPADAETTWQMFLLVGSDTT